jgi:putative transposase
MKTFKYRIYPSTAQATQLNQQLEICRWVYNKTLETRKDAFELDGVALNYYDTKKMLPAWKEERPVLKRVHSMVLQDVVLRVDLAYRAFFRRVKAGEEPGYPRFKGHDRYDSMCYPQYGNGAKLVGNQLNLSRIGSVKVKLHRELIGTPKTVCIRRSSTGKWFVTIACEGEKSILPAEPKRIGIDVGTATFATLSDGEKIKNPRFFKREANDLAKAQRRLEQAAKGTPERTNRKRVISRIHERIANKRSDFAHKLSRQWVNTYGVIVLEDLNIVGMMEEHTVVFGSKLNKSIADVAWSQLAQFTAYKAEDAGRLCLQVDPRNTSKMCSRCRSLVPKTLKDRVHNCPHCGLVLDRDHNAAINILALGLQRINAGSPDEVVEAPQP